MPPTAGGMGSIAQGTKVPHAMWFGQKQKKPDYTSHCSQHATDGSWGQIEQLSLGYL